MATASITDFLQNLRRASLLREQGPTDSQLLECFAQSRDEGAFEALVYRHGPMVLGVCRRILRNNHDAEDAFQATFLVLASRARTVKPRHMLVGWLYGVACNTALKLRGRVARRRVKEREAAAMPRPDPPSDAWLHLEPLLDLEVRGLPDKYRVPIVLCDLEGKTRKGSGPATGLARRHRRQPAGAGACHLVWPFGPARRGPFGQRGGRGRFPEPGSGLDASGAGDGSD